MDDQRRRDLRRGGAQPRPEIRLRLRTAPDAVDHPTHQILRQRHPVMQRTALGGFRKRTMQSQVQHDLLEARRHVAGVRQTQREVQGEPPRAASFAVVVVAPQRVHPVQRLHGALHVRPTHAAQVPTLRAWHARRRLGRFLRRIIGVQLRRHVLVRLRFQPHLHGVAIRRHALAAPPLRQLRFQFLGR